MPISERTRACPLCHRPLPDPPAAPMCEHCGRLAAPHHSEWPLYMKWWLLSELARRRFHGWLSEQNVWEWLLRDAMVGSGGISTPNPRGPRFTTGTPAADLYPRALELATEWKGAGSPIAHAIDLTTRSA